MYEYIVVLVSKLTYKIKGNGHNSQTQQYFILFYYIIALWATCFDSYSSHLQALKIKIQTYKCLLHCGIPDAYRIKGKHYTYK